MNALILCLAFAAPFAGQDKVDFNVTQDSVEIKLSNGNKIA